MNRESSRCRTAAPLIAKSILLFQRRSTFRPLPVLAARYLLRDGYPWLQLRKCSDADAVEIGRRDIAPRYGLAGDEAPIEYLIECAIGVQLDPWVVIRHVIGRKRQALV